jgi:hypothetical protein
LHAWQSFGSLPQVVLQHTPSTQMPLRHWSVALHAAPGLPCGLHLPPEQKLPAVQPLSSAQPPAQLLPEQTDGLQSIGGSVGQLALEPVQLTGGMAVLPVQLGAWHCVELLLNESGGQSFELPGQNSATSHTPGAPRQTVPLWNVSAGHALCTPSQTSATSHVPALGRQVVPFKITSGGQLGELPLQDSAGSHAPPGRHTPLVLKLSGGQFGLEPSQNSGWSHAAKSAAARHCKPALPAGY